MIRMLVTGGAGYVGRFVVRKLLRCGHRVTVVDDLSTGNLSSVPPGADFVRCNVGDCCSWEYIFDQPDVVLHLAASAYVSESLEKPREYWSNNFSTTRLLADWCVATGVPIVFASSCSVYGNGGVGGPVSPYGRTKRAAEDLLKDYSDAYGLRYVVLRLYNVAGAGDDTGEEHDPEPHLIPNALRAAMGGERIKTYDDWRTTTRDYVHVKDVAEVFSAAVMHLIRGGSSMVEDVSSGRGSTVFDVLAVCERCCGGKVETDQSNVIRTGDASSIIGPGGNPFSVGMGRSSLGCIIKSAWEWEMERTT